MVELTLGALGFLLILTNNFFFFIRTTVSMPYTWRVYKSLNGNWKPSQQIGETESHPSSGSFWLIVSTEFRWPLLMLLG